MVLVAGNSGYFGTAGLLEGFWRAVSSTWPTLGSTCSWPVPVITLDANGGFSKSVELPPGNFGGAGFSGEPGWSFQTIDLFTLEVSRARSNSSCDGEGEGSCSAARLSPLVSARDGDRARAGTSASPPSSEIHSRPSGTSALGASQATKLPLTESPNGETNRERSLVADGVVLVQHID